MDKRTKFQKIRKSIENQIDDSHMLQKVRTELDRAEYVDELMNMRKKLYKKTTKKDVENFKFRFFGEVLTSRKDILFMRYTITDKTHEKTDKMVSYIKSLMAATGVDNYFDPATVRVIGKNGDVGDQVKIMVFRHDHEFKSISSNPVDSIGSDGDNDDGSGGGDDFGSF